MTTPSATAVVDEEPVRRRGRHRHDQRRRILPVALSRGGWSLLVATIGIGGFNLIFNLLISRLLGPSRYGALGAVLQALTVLAVPIGALQLAVTKAVASGTGTRRRSLRSLTAKVSLWGFGAMVAVLVLSPLMDSFLNLKSPLTPVVLSVWVPFAVVGAVLQGALLGQLRFVPVAVATFLGGGALRLASGALLVLSRLRLRRRAERDGDQPGIHNRNLSGGREAGSIRQDT